MSVAIPFPLPATGFALNSKVRVNLDFIVSKFNEFNTGTATWDAVYVGTGGSINGAITLYNSTNGYYTTIQSGVASANQTYTWPTAVPPTATSILQSTTGGVLSWTSSPTLTGLSVGTGGTINGGIYNIYTSIRFINSITGYTTAFVNASGKPDVADLTFSWPSTLGNANEVLSVDGSGHMAWASAATLAGGATKALDNLVSTAINAHLIPDSANDTQLGSFTYPWSEAYVTELIIGKDNLAGQIKIYPPTIGKGQFFIEAADNTGADTIILTHASQIGHRTFTIPRTDNNASFVMDNTAQTITGTKTISDLVGTGVIYLADGLVGTPSLSFVNDPDNGFFLVSANTWSAVTAGAEVFRFTSTGVQLTGNFASTSAGKTISMVGSTSGTLTLAAGNTTTPYTLKFPPDAGTVDYILRTDGAGTTTWVSVSAAGGANNTLSNLADTVAINKNLNNFSAGTITATLTGTASGNLALSAGSGQELTGDLYLPIAKHIVFHDGGLTRFVQIAMAAVSNNWTMTLPTNHGTINQILVDSDGAGTLGWAAAASGTVNSGTAGRLALYATTTTAVSDTYVQNTKNINVVIAAHATLAANRVYTIPDTGASASFVLTEGNFNMNGAYSMSTAWITSLGFPGARDIFITYAVPAGSSKSYNLADVGANCDFVMTAGTQTVSGTKTFSGTTTISGTISPAIDNTTNLGSSSLQWAITYSSAFEAGRSGLSGSLSIYPSTASTGYMYLYATASSGNYLLQITNAALSASRLYTIPDAGTNASFVMTEGTQTINGTTTFTQDIFTVAYTDYSATSTIVGWSSFSTKKLYYKKVGKLVWVFFYLDGTSDSTALTFTLPFTSSNDVPMRVIVQAIDNGGAFTVGIAELPNNSSTVTCYKNITETAWTNANEKYVAGQFFYQTT
jgi:hypothetical protein